jgi:hypothetical protein
MAEKTLTALIQKAYVHAVSTRSVDLGAQPKRLAL